MNKEIVVKKQQKNTTQFESSPEVTLKTPSLSNNAKQLT